MIKGSIWQEDMTFINICVPNIRVSKYIKKILTDQETEINSNKITVGDFNTLLTRIHRTSRQTIKEKLT